MDDADDADVAAAIAGDREAMSRVWRRHRRWAAAVACAHRVPPHALEDVLQDTALTVVRQLRQLRAPAAFRAWLRVVVVHAVQAVRQREPRRLAAAAGPGADELPDPRPADADLRERLDSVLATIARMQPEYREPMWLRAVQGLTQQQVADTLGVPVTTVETRLARARAMLRASFPDSSPRPADTPANCEPPPTR